MSTPGLHFDWDSDKARSNLVKHGVSFDEAASAFRDPAAVLIPDPDHSSGPEDRELLLGYGERTRLLLVVHTEYDEQCIRIISARRATAREREQYHQGLG